MGVLEDAVEIVADRGRDYGNAETMYRHIAALWSAWLAAGVTPADVIHMLIQMKQVRDKIARGHHDSRVDIAGYAAVLDLLNVTDDR